MASALAKAGIFRARATGLHGNGKTGGRTRIVPARFVMQRHGLAQLLGQSPGFENKTSQRGVIDTERLALTRQQIDAIDICAIDKVGIEMRGIFEQRKLPTPWSRAAV